MLTKVVYRHEYMDDLENFNERILPAKEEFYYTLDTEVLEVAITCIRKEFAKTLK